MTQRDVWDSQIIFVPHQPEVPSDPELVTLFDDVTFGFLGLLDGACVLGIRNPYAEGLFLEGEESSFKVDESLRNSDMFITVFGETCEDAEVFRETLRKVALELEMHQADARARATEEPKDAMWRIQALEYALEQEKAWSQKLEEERDELRVQLRAARRQNRTLQNKRLKKARFSSLPENPLSCSIGAALKTKESPDS